MEFKNISYYPNNKICYAYDGYTSDNISKYLDPADDDREDDSDRNERVELIQTDAEII